MHYQIFDDPFREFGIVLRRFTSTTCKFSVLTKSQGKIMVIIVNKHNAMSIHPGMVIAFATKEKRDNVSIVERAQVLETHWPKHLDEMYWVSHLLEICYFFIPLHQPCEECFIVAYSNLVLLGYRLSIDDLWPVMQKLCIGVLLTSLGFSPPESLMVPLSTVQRALLRFIDFTEEQKVEFCSAFQHAVGMIEAGKLESWLVECIQTHPRACMFKTVAFMYNTSSLYA